MDQGQNAITQPHNDLTIGPRHRLCQVLRKAAITFDVCVDSRRYPDKPVVAKNNGRTARQIVEMCFAPFDQWRENGDQNALRQFAILQASCVQRQAAVDEDVLNFSGNEVALL